MMKRALFVLAAGMLAIGSLAGCGTGAAKKAESTTAAVEAAAETTAEAAGSDWYNKALTDQELTGKYPYYKMIDVNKDGVPVLIMSSTDQAFIGDEDRASLMIYSDGEAKVVKEIGGKAGESFYYNEAENYISYYSRMSGEGHLEVCQVKDGELAVVKTFDYYAPHHNPEVDNDEAIYRIDGEDVSEADYTKAWNGFAAEDCAVTYEAIQ